MDVAKRRGTKRAKVALARKLGVILHADVDGGNEFPLDEGGVKGATSRSRLDKTERLFEAVLTRAASSEVPSPGTMEPVKPENGQWPS